MDNLNATVHGTSPNSREQSPKKESEEFKAEFIYPLDKIPNRINNIELGYSDRERLAQGKYSSLLTGIKTSDGIRDAKAKLIPNKNGEGFEVSLQYKSQALSIPKKIGRKKLSQEDQKQLTEGKPLFLKKNMFLKLDTELNTVTVQSSRDFNIPKKIGSYELSQADKHKLAAGQKTPQRLLQRNGRFYLSNIALTQNEHGHNTGVEFSGIQEVSPQWAKENMAEINKHEPMQDMVKDFAEMGSDSIEHNQNKERNQYDQSQDPTHSKETDHKEKSTSPLQKGKDFAHRQMQKAKEMSPDLTTMRNQLNFDIDKLAEFSKELSAKAFTASGTNTKALDTIQDIATRIDAMEKVNTIIDVAGPMLSERQVKDLTLAVADGNKQAVDQVEKEVAVSFKKEMQHSLTEGIAKSKPLSTQSQAHQRFKNDQLTKMASLATPKGEAIVLKDKKTNKSYLSKHGALFQINAKKAQFLSTNEITEQKKKKSKDKAKPVAKKKATAKQKTVAKAKQRSHKQINIKTSKGGDISM